MPSVERTGYDYEDDLAVESATYLDLVLPPDAVWWHTPNQGHGVGRTTRSQRDAMLMARKLRAMGMRPGIPDVAVVWRGRIHMTDAKSSTGTLTDSQKGLFPKLESAGVLLKPVYRTIGELESYLIDWGIPLNFLYTDLKHKMDTGRPMLPSQARAMNTIVSASSTIRSRRSARQGGKAHGVRKPASPFA